MGRGCELHLFPHSSLFCPMLSNQTSLFIWSPVTSWSNSGVSPQFAPLTSKRSLTLQSPSPSCHCLSLGMPGMAFSSFSSYLSDPAFSVLPVGSSSSLLQSTAGIPEHSGLSYSLLIPISLESVSLHSFTCYLARI